MFVFILPVTQWFYQTADTCNLEDLVLTILDIVGANIDMFLGERIWFNDAIPDIV